MFLRFTQILNFDFLFCLEGVEDWEGFLHFSFHQRTKLALTPVLRIGALGMSLSIINVGGHPPNSKQPKQGAADKSVNFCFQMFISWCKYDANVNPVSRHREWCFLLQLVHAFWELLHVLENLCWCGLLPALPLPVLAQGKPPGCGWMGLGLGHRAVTSGQQVKRYVAPPASDSGGAVRSTHPSRPLQPHRPRAQPAGQQAHSCGRRPGTGLEPDQPVSPPVYGDQCYVSLERSSLTSEYLLPFVRWCRPLWGNAVSFNVLLPPSPSKVGSLAITPLFEGKTQGILAYSWSVKYYIFPLNLMHGLFPRDTQMEFSNRTNRHPLPLV